jgi:hypothetical protein
MVLICYGPIGVEEGTYPFHKRIPLNSRIDSEALEVVVSKPSVSEQTCRVFVKVQECAPLTVKDAPPLLL